MTRVFFAFSYIVLVFKSHDFFVSIVNNKKWIQVFQACFLKCCAKTVLIKLCGFTLYCIQFTACTDTLLWLYIPCFCKMCKWFVFFWPKERKNSRGYPEQETFLWILQHIGMLLSMIPERICFGPKKEHLIDVNLIERSLLDTVKLWYSLFLYNVHCKNYQMNKSIFDSIIPLWKLKILPSARKHRSKRSAF